MSPLPTTRVIHPGLLAALRPVAQGAMTAACVITHPVTSPGPFNATSGRYEPDTGTAIYTGPCRVQSLERRSADPDQVGDNPTTLMLYQVTIPWSADAVAVDCPLLLTAGPDDELTGRRMRILEVAYADLQAERRLLCQLDEG